MKVSEIKGYKGFRAFNAFHKLMLGLKMLPHYLAKPYEQFFDMIAEMPAEDQRKVIREAAVFVDLEKEELEAMACFAHDPNGVAYEPSNLKNADPQVILNIIESVGFEIVKFRIDSVTETEKKNSETSPSI